MIGDAWTAFARDLDDAAKDIADAETPKREAAALLAGEVANQAPVLSGFLAGSVFSDSEGVGVGAEYAAIVHALNPYAERAVDLVDWVEPFEKHLEDALSSNIRPLYV